MKLAPARLAAFGALLAIDRGTWSAEALAAKSVQLDSRDAGLASDIVFGTLRRRGELDAAIGKYSKRGVDKLDAAVRIALEMALYQIRFLDRVPGHAAVNDSVELARKAGKASAAAFVNAVLRRAIREPLEIEETLSTPAWLLGRWAAQYGADTALAIAHAGLTPSRTIYSSGKRASARRRGAHRCPRLFQTHDRGCRMFSISGHRLPSRGSFARSPARPQISRRVRISRQ